MKLNKQLIEQYIEKRILTSRKHPTEPLTILKYDRECQYSKLWDDITTICRGIIVDDEYNILYRPFSKFFNYEEIIDVNNTNEFLQQTHSQLINNIKENVPFKITEKLDGSCGILYFIDDIPFITTMKSFDSKQAIEGTKILNEIYPSLSKNDINESITYIFEIIYKENRIVCDYTDMRNLILIGQIETDTGKEVYDTNHPFTSVELSNFKSINELKSYVNANEYSNSEGFVATFDDGLKMKFKYEEYFRIHKIISTLNEKSLWEELVLKKTIQEILNNIPDNYQEWSKDVLEDLCYKFHNILIENIKAHLSIITEIHSSKIACNKYTLYGLAEHKKKYAQHAINKYSKEFVYSSILFCMYDMKKCDRIIWSILKPKKEKNENSSHI